MLSIKPFLTILKWLSPIIVAVGTHYVDAYFQAQIDSQEQIEMGKF